MADPTGSYTFQDLILRVATAAGIAYHGTTGQRKSMIPVHEEYLFDLCKRVVNDGIKMFIAAAPYPGGWRWMRRLYELTFSSCQVEGTADAASATSLTDVTLKTDYTVDNQLTDYYIYITAGTGKGSNAKITVYDCAAGKIYVAAWLTIDGLSGGTTPVVGDSYSITSVHTIEGDKSRYALPDNFGRCIGKITYKKDSGRGCFGGWADESQLRVNKEVSETDSYPVYASIRAYRDRKWEIVFDPSPSAADTVVIPYETGFNELQLMGGLATAAATTTLTDSAIINLYSDDTFNEWNIYIIDYTGRGSYGIVTDYVGSTGVFTIAAGWLAPDGVTVGITPAATSAYYLEPVGNKHPAGWQFDNVVLAACLAQAQLQIENMKGDYLNKFLNLDLVAARLQDLRSAPLKLMSNVDRSDYERRKDVTYT